MGIFKKRMRSNVAFLTSPEAFETLCVSGYTTLDKNPEIMTAVRTISTLISSMTIYLMANTKKGDMRIKNELSRRVDINPSPYMTRRTWMESIVSTMLLYGKGNSVVWPHTSGGYLGELEPIAYTRVNFKAEGRGYKILIDGVEHDPENLLHFVFNPDPIYPWKGKGVQVALKDVANNLKQAAATTKGFLGSKYKPSLVVKVDAMTEEFSSQEGRQRLLESYVKGAEAGEPWLIPAEQFEVEQVKPLTLADLAIADVVQMDKRTVASILGVPAFVLGVGEFKADAWNAFITNTVQPIAKAVEQELTRKLIISPEWYWKFNITSLYAYDVKTLADVYSGLYIKGIVKGNEVRDKLNLEPLDGLDELVVLENYIPLDKIGDQKKLNQEE